MSLLEMLKSNLAMTAGVVGSAVIIITAIFTVDERYAHASDVAQYNQQTSQTIRETADSLRKQMLEDKIFELDIKRSQSRDNRLSPVDQAMRDRYQRQLDDLKIQAQIQNQTQSQQVQQKK